MDNKNYYTWQHQQQAHSQLKNTNQQQFLQVEQQHQHVRQVEQQ